MLSSRLTGFITSGLMLSGCPTTSERWYEKPPMIQSFTFGICAIMIKQLKTIVAIILLMLAVCCSCSSAKQLQTQSTAESNTHSIGHIEDVIRTGGVQEYWVVPTERNGVVVNDTIRHRIDLNDTIHHRVHVTDTIHTQVLQEQTKAKVPQNQKGLRETILSNGKISDAPSVALIISIGINTILILVIFTVYFLKSNHTV